ncbi:hypothetical protein VQ042_01415 [Aurantimonas sp. A2-1-M11]|uniref:hypothetical protein n=1 Tax=Aurantimonas sp. A2-1-M11 TaxID=3113712 RepID=UPI002F93F199
MSEKSKRYITLKNAHGAAVVIVPMMVTHVGSRGATEAEVFFVGGASIALKGSADEVAMAIFG